MTERYFPSVLALTAAGLIGLALHEGYKEAAYDDGVGVQTVGFGSTRLADGQPVRRGDRLPVPRALVRLGDDVARFEREMRACIGEVPLYQREWDAYVSLTYNIGAGTFCRSTLVRKLKGTPPDYVAACAEILRWNRAGGQVSVGLSRRRAAEFKLCSAVQP